MLIVPALHTILAASIVISLVYLTAMAGAAIVGALRVGGRRSERAAGDDALSMSRFTIPVSVIVPAPATTGSLSRAITAALALNYPEFEVIVVVEGGHPADIDALTREWQLEAKEFFYRCTIATAPVMRIHRSLRDSRLMVVDKAPAGHGDAINCGVNLARYRYIVSLSPALTYDPDALLRLMAAALRDPGNVLGASNHVEDGALFPRLVSIRSQMESRLAWSRLPSGVVPKRAVVAWRRDAVLGAGGFSVSAADTELEMMFRLQSPAAEAAGRFNRGTEVFGRMGPRTIGEILGQTGGRQRATMALLGACLTGAGRLAPRTLAYFVSADVLAPLAQSWVIVGTVAGAAAGWFDWSHVLQAVVWLSFGNAAVSAAALLLRGARPDAPETGELMRMLAAAPLEFVLVRPFLVGARLLGTFSLGSRHRHG